MVPRDIDWTLLSRYLAGEVTALERERVRAWLAADASHAVLLAELERIWDASEASGKNAGVGRTPDLPDLTAHWEEVRRAVSHDGSASRDDAVARIIPLHAAPSAASRPAVPSPRRPLRPSRRSRYATLAQSLWVFAVLLVIAGGVLIAQRWVAPTTTAGDEAVTPLFREVATKRGQQAQVRLADGTQVVLNASSTLRIPSTFNEAVREVYLEGEAFFDVAHLPERRFTIHAGEAVAQVLGTSFNVTAYPEDGDVQIAVVEGRVSLRPEHLSVRDTVLLGPNTLGILTGGLRAEVRRGVRLDRYLAWTEGRIVWAHAPFDQVARELERRYDIEIELRAPPASLPPLNASFEDESLAEILETVAAALNLRYRSEKRNVVFYPAGAGGP